PRTADLADATPVCEEAAGWPVAMVEWQEGVPCAHPPGTREGSPGWVNRTAPAPIRRAGGIDESARRPVDSGFALRYSLVNRSIDQ
ncbi:MAG: hypothetical protein M3Y83_13650, partial [Actinomycetota bacterium]|nr:hypothetical protein [Actinomycetota bacterium]